MRPKLPSLPSLACRGEAGIPDGAEEEVEGIDHPEEVDRFEQHRQHDADGREDGNGRRKDQGDLDIRLDQIAGAPAWA